MHSPRAKEGDLCLALGTTSMTKWEVSEVVDYLAHNRFLPQRYNTLTCNCHDLRRGSYVPYLWTSKEPMRDQSSSTGSIWQQQPQWELAWPPPQIPILLPIVASGFVAFQVVEKVVPRMGLS